jgi:hypothetical protein
MMRSLEDRMALAEDVLGFCRDLGQRGPETAR